MRFIDKELNQKAAHKILHEYLARKWQADRGAYEDMNYYYDDVSFRCEPTAKPRLKELLLQEQNGLCCYCMSVLTDTNCTFEHIVPKRATIIDFEKYTHYRPIEENVILQSEFVKRTTPITAPPFPHTIAYENLSLSCDGKIENGNEKHYCCNHERGKKLIEPLFLRTTIADEIRYMPDGQLFPTNLFFKSTIKKLNLNYILLKQIRQVWYHISNVPLEIIEEASDSNAEFKRKSILNLHLSIDNRKQLIAIFKVKSYWDLLLQYKWFHSYYKHSTIS